MEGCSHCWAMTHGRRYCDKCALWWLVHSAHWQLWSVVQSQCTDNLVSRVCQDDCLGKLICDFLVPWSSFVVHTGLHEISLSMSAWRRGYSWGLRTEVCVLERLVSEFNCDPEYLHRKGFSIIKCRSAHFHIIASDEMSCRKHHLCHW